jgi:hypothetical protein
MKSVFLSIVISLCSIQAFSQAQLPNYNNWKSFFQEFKTSLIKDNENKFLSLSNKTLADMSAKEWIKSAKSGSEFSILQKTINSKTVDSEGANKKTIDFADTNNCYLEFRLTKSGWKLFNVVYYAD